MKIRPEKIKNILVLRNDRFGEFLLNIPALRALKETFVNSKIIAVVSPNVAELAQYVPFIDEIIAWQQIEHSFREKWRMVNLLKSKKIAIAVMLNPSQEFNQISFLAGVPVRLGYDRKWGFLLNRKLEDTKYLGQKHETEYNLDLVGVIGAKTNDKTPTLSLTDEPSSDLLSGFGIKTAHNFVVIHPFTSDSSKQWPIEYFWDLSRRISSELKIKVVISGGKEELGKTAGLFISGKDQMFNLIGKTTLIQLAMIIRKARLLISGDSGPVHLASSVGTPVVAIFRNDIPAKGPIRWGPLSPRSIVVQKNKLSEITSDEVFIKVKEALERK